MRLTGLEGSLMEFGLTSKEAKVYLACLELGSATVNDIAKRTRIFRTYCYDILRGLQQKGLIASVSRKNIQFFEPAHPEKLLGILEERKSRIKEAIPQLVGLYKSAAAPAKVNLFEGVEGVKSIHEDILAAGKESFVMSGTERIMEHLGPYFELYIKKRTERRLAAHVISEDTPAARERIQPLAAKELRNVRFTKKLIGQGTTIYLYGDKVAIVVWEEEPFGVILQNQKVYNTFKVLFEEMWEGSGEEKPRD